MSIENIGKTDLDVDAVRVRVWRKELLHPIGQNAEFLDVDKLEETQPWLDLPVTNGNLVQHYLPKNQSSETFTWVINQTEPRIYLFRADVSDKGQKLGMGRRWRDDLCPSK